MTSHATSIIVKRITLNTIFVLAAVWLFEAFMVLVYMVRFNSAEQLASSWQTELQAVILPLVATLFHGLNAWGFRKAPVVGAVLALVSSVAGLWFYVGMGTYVPVWIWYTSFESWLIMGPHTFKLLCYAVLCLTAPLVIGFAVHQRRRAASSPAALPVK